ncbi:MAG: hypothetical protein ACPGUI_00380 [Halarcobacter sp.]
MQKKLKVAIKRLGKTTIQNINEASVAIKTSIILSTAQATIYAADDDVFVPFFTWLKNVLQGYFGALIALVLIAGGVIYGAMGGGIKVALSAMFFGILIGAIPFVANTSFTLGTTFG